MARKSDALGQESCRFVLELFSIESTKRQKVNMDPHCLRPFVLPCCIAPLIWFHGCSLAFGHDCRGRSSLRMSLQEVGERKESSSSVQESNNRCQKYDRNALPSSSVDVHPSRFRVVHKTRGFGQEGSDAELNKFKKLCRVSSNLSPNTNVC